MGFYFKKLRDDAVIPQRATPGSAGMDLVAAIDQAIPVGPGETKLIGTGLAASIPPGYEIQVRPRSGLALKHGLTVLNAPGTVDSDYRGEIGVILHNTSQKTYHVNPGERIAQMVVTTYSIGAFFQEVDDLDATNRGAGGFGSTGN